MGLVFSEEPLSIVRPFNRIVFKASIAEGVVSGIFQSFGCCGLWLGNRRSVRLRLELRGKGSRDLGRTAERRLDDAIVPELADVTRELRVADRTAQLDLVSFVDCDRRVTQFELGHDDIHQSDEGNASGSTNPPNS